MNQLTELLCIEKEAVYRRLRKDVSFSFSEIELISRKYQISLDQIIGSHAFTGSMLFYLMDYDFVNTAEKDIQTTENSLARIATIKEDPNSEVGCAMNTIPLALVKSNEHHHIFKFSVYKWMYQYGNYNQFPLFSEFTLPDRLCLFNDIYRKDIAYSNYTYYIFDENIFSNLIKDISYFRSVGFISEEEIAILKAELLDFLDYLAIIAMNGRFDTGKKVDFFITQMTIESSYSYVDSENCCFIFHKLFNMNDAVSSEPKDLPLIKKWLKSLKKSSSQISESGELIRIQYFEKQQEIVNQL
ncbi:MAG: hypothetical protein LUG98_16630 [Tannerellaceae bacterium]|nr:hypothetical protein [Tannerellaceae bacterium]